MNVLKGYDMDNGTQILKKLAKKKKNPDLQD